MRAYLAIGADPRAGGDVLVRDAITAALRLAPETLPYPAADGRSASWIAPDGATALPGLIYRDILRREARGAQDTTPTSSVG